MEHVKFLNWLNYIKERVTKSQTKHDNSKFLSIKYNYNFGRLVSILAKYQDYVNANNELTKMSDDQKSIFSENV
jgi:hypothetical protein